MINLKLQEEAARSYAKKYVVTIFVLLLIGLVFIYSSSSVFGLDNKYDAAFYVKKQLVAIFIGLILFFLVNIIPASKLKKLIPIFFAGTFILTCLTLIPGLGVKTFGSKRWLKLGITFQPSEFLKCSFIGYIADILACRSQKLVAVRDLFFKICFLLAIVSSVLLLQPDFGMTVTIIFTSLSMFLLVPGASKYVFISSLFTLPGAILLILTKSYRLKRILTFLDPWKDPEGSGFQIIQSWIAIGSGGMLGNGIGYSKQKFFYLPMQHTDFIMAIIAEETGFLGVSILFFIYLYLLWIGCRWANNVQSSLAHYLIIGYTWLVIFQMIMNTAVVSGLFPTKGLGLPFISYGSTAIIALIWYLGVILKIAKE